MSNLWITQTYFCLKDYTTAECEVLSHFLPSVVLHRLVLPCCRHCIISHILTKQGFKNISILKVDLFDMFSVPFSEVWHSLLISKNMSIPLEQPRNSWMSIISVLFQLRGWRQILLAACKSTSLARMKMSFGELSTHTEHFKLRFRDFSLYRWYIQMSYLGFLYYWHVYVIHMKQHSTYFLSRWGGVMGNLSLRRIKILFF